MTELLLTPEQAALRLQLNPATVRRQLQRGALRGVKRGRVWRVPESALTETSATVADDSVQQVNNILDRLRSSDNSIRNTAIFSILQANRQVRALVDEAVQKEMSAYVGQDDDFADWHALDGEPFHLLDEEESQA